MAKPTQDAIDTFMSITGASNSVAVRKLEEYHGNLNRAVNAYFTEGDQNSLHDGPANIAEDDAMDIDDVTPALQRETNLSLDSEARTTVPFPLRDPNFERSLFDHDPLMPRPPFVSHPREVRQIPIEVKDSSGPSGQSNSAPTIEDVTHTSQAHGPAAQETVIIDEESDDDSQQYAPTGQSRHAIPVGSAHNNLQDYNDIEEEMIRAAIEASKTETGVPRNQLPENHQSRLEDDDVTKAVTMSSKSAEEEVLRSQGWKASTSEREATDVVSIPEQQGTLPSNGRFTAPSSLSDDDDPDYVEEEPLVRHRPRRAVSGSRSPPNNDLAGSPEAEDAFNYSPDAGSGFPSEWGGISSEEHDEAVMLEAAMFGGIPESEYSVPYAPYSVPYAPYPQRTQRPPSPSLTAQRLIREQQDDEYLASLEADREKAEARRLEEEAARVEALEEEKRKEEEARRKVEEEQELFWFHMSLCNPVCEQVNPSVMFGVVTKILHLDGERELERQLVSKEASLPQEPPAGEENAITLLVRLPDGTRHGRRFLKSDKLQSLFDFIDICRVVKPNTYRLIRPFPRHAFGDGESSSTLNDVGLTSKQEALFLELI